MKKFLLIAMMALLCLGAVYSALNTPFWTQRLLPLILARQVKGLRVTACVIKSQNFRWPGTFSFKDISFQAAYGAEKISGTLPALEIVGVETFFSARKIFVINFDQAWLRSSQKEAREIAAQLVVFRDKRGIFHLEGPFHIGSAAWDKITATDVSGKMAATSEGVTLESLLLEAYGGKVKGSGTCSFQPLFYDVDLILSDLSTLKLAEVNGQVSEQLAGQLSGRVVLSGDALHLRTLFVEMAMPSGGKVNAALLSTLIQYLPQSVERKRLDELIKLGGKLKVEVFSLTMKNDKPDHISGEVHLVSKEANLNINLTHEIRTDGSLESLMQSWDAIFKK